MLETLDNIKDDLERTAVHLESLSAAMSGHFVYLDQRGGHFDGVDVANHIASIRSSVQTLRCAASRIDQHAEPVVIPLDPHVAALLQEEE